MKMLKNKSFPPLLLKKKYSKPKIRKIGLLKNITLKTGSRPDLGGNFYQP
jgi:hypothetical protein